MTTSNKDTEYESNLADLRGWRTEDPVLWATLRGWGGLRNIAIAAGEDVPTTLTKLNEYIEVGWVGLNNSGVYYLRKESNMYRELIRLKDFSTQMDVDTVLKYPSGNLDNANLSRSAKEALKDRAAEVKEQLSFLKRDRKTFLLTDAQLNNFNALRDMFVEEVEVSPGEYEDDSKPFTRDGYRKAKIQAGLPHSNLMYLDNELRSLVNKGLLEHIERPIKGQWFAFTPFGVEYQHVEMTAEERAIKRGINWEDEQGAQGKARGPRPGAEKRANGDGPTSPLLQMLERGPLSTQQVADARGITRSAAHKQLTRHLDAGRVTREVMGDGSSRWALVM